MKKLYTLLMLAAVSIPALAQQAVDESRLLPETGPRIIKKQPLQTRVNEVSKWVSFAQYVYENTSYNYYRNYVFPDSTVRVDYSTSGWGPVWKHSMGQVFDATSMYYAIIDAEMPITQYMPYTIDSIAIPYRYFRFQNDAPDTLRLQYYVGNKITTVATPTGTGWPPGVSYATVQYSHLTRTGTNFTQQLDRLLTTTDTAAIVKEFIIPVGIAMSPNQKFAVTATYFPGNPFNEGDTIDVYTTAIVTNPINAFIMFDIRDNDMTTDPGKYNHESLVNSTIRYNYNAQGWNGRYIPGVAFNNGFYHSDIYFRITYDLDLVGINAVTEPAQMGLYPNPANQAVYLSTNVEGNSAFVLTNAVGQVVKSWNQVVNANDAVHISTTELPTGVYHVNIQNGTASATARFVKQ